jgi:hypothetical protein
MVCCRYGVMRTLGYTTMDCRRKLALGTGDARLIEQRLKSAAERLDLGSENADPSSAPAPG